VPCKKQLGAIPSPGSVTELPPPDAGSNRKESAGKTSWGRNGRAGRADWRPSVTVDPMVIECPENCRNGIAWLQDKEPESLQAGCRPHGDDATKFCLPWETNPRDGGLLLRCSTVATVFGTVF
jgi:hypothetical protein